MGVKPIYDSSSELYSINSDDKTSLEEFLFNEMQTRQNTMIRRKAGRFISDDGKRVESVNPQA